MLTPTSWRPAIAAATQKPEACTMRPGNLVQKPQYRQQAMLGVSYCCPDCGLCLGPLEGALHKCTMALEWPFAAETVARAWVGTGVKGAGGCRIVRLGAELLAPAACAQFEALWDFVRGDMSHGLDPPAARNVATGACVILLSLRKHEVVGLLWAEPIITAQLVEAEPILDTENTMDEATSVPNIKGQLAKSRKVLATLGICFIWVQRSERRKGLATALVEAARRDAAGFGAPPVLVEQVAFSQLTNLGLTFARKYLRAIHAGQVLIYNPMQC